MHRRPPFLFALVFAFTLASCTSPAPSPAIAPSSTPSPTNTPEPSATPTREVHLIGSDEPTPDPDAWVYVVLGDSEAWGVGEYYADYIAEDHGVEVQLYDAWRGQLSTKGLLTMLEIDNTLRAFLAEAEVITFEANPMEYFDWYCFDGSGEFDNSEESWLCTRLTWMP